MQLRPYQSEFIAEVQMAFRSHDSALGILPTGCGKTFVFAHLGHGWPTGRVLVLAHREELINQAADEILAVTGERPDIEQAERKAAPTMYGGSKFVVASVQTLYRQSRLSRPEFAPHHFGLVIVDEAHHSSRSNVTYRRILDHFRQNPACRFLGVTATADRSDGKGLGETFATVAYRYSLRDAIGDGWLVPIRQQYVVCTSLDLAAVKTKGRRGDFQDDSLAELMERDRPLYEVAGGILKACEQRPTIIFAASIAHAEKLADILNSPSMRDEFGRGAAVVVHGGNADHPLSTDQRRRRLKSMADGEYQFLVGVDCFYEGFNLPPLACVAVARPTKSRSRYTQAVGRGTRTLRGVALDHFNAGSRLESIAKSDKPDLLVLDFVGASANLKLDLIDTADILAGDGVSRDVLRRAKKKAQAKGGTADMLELVAETEAEAERETERDRRRAVSVRGQWESVDVDPFAFDGESHAAGAALAGDRLPVTSKQAAYLERMGLDPDRYHRKQASALIEKYRGKPTPNQAKALARNGESAKIHRDKANALMDLLNARRWKRRTYQLTRDRWSLRQDGSAWVPVINDPDVGRVVLKTRRFNSQEACRAFIQNCIEDYTTRPLAAA